MVTVNSPLQVGVLRFYSVLAVSIRTLLSITSSFSLCSYASLLSSKEQSLEENLAMQMVGKRAEGRDL